MIFFLSPFSIDSSLSSSRRIDGGSWSVKYHHREYQPLPRGVRKMTSNCSECCTPQIYLVSQLEICSSCFICAVRESDCFIVSYFIRITIYSNGIDISGRYTILSIFGKGKGRSTKWMATTVWSTITVILVHRLQENTVCQRWTRWDKRGKRGRKLRSIDLPMW